jgi:hypothetical protein
MNLRSFKLGVGLAFNSTLFSMTIESLAHGIHDGCHDGCDISFTVIRDDIFCFWDFWELVSELERRIRRTVSFCMFIV